MIHRQRKNSEHHVRIISKEDCTVPEWLMFALEQQLML